MLGLLTSGRDLLNVANLEDTRLNFWIPSDWNEFPILFSKYIPSPIRANVRWIHYLWPPLFPLFFHRIKPRGRRESLSIFHSSVATKILVFCQFFRLDGRKVGGNIKFYLMLLSPQRWISFVLSKRRSDILPSLWTKNNTKCMNLTIYYNTYRKLLIHIIIWKGHNPHLHSAQI